MGVSWSQLQSRLRGMCSPSSWKRGMIMSGYTLQFKI